MAPTVWGQNRDIAAALDPRLDAKNSGMASIFRPSVSGKSIEKQQPICRNFYLDVVGCDFLIRKISF